LRESCPKTVQRGEPRVQSGYIKDLVKSVMHFSRALFFSIGLFGAVFFMADTASAHEQPTSTTRFNLKSGDLPANLPVPTRQTGWQAGRLNLEEVEDGVSVTNDISVRASTGGNSASGANGQSGGTIQTGNAKARVEVKTEVGDEATVDIEEEYEGEAEIERKFESASGTVKTKIRVEVSSSASSTVAATSAPLLKEERVKEKGSWFSRWWPFGKDDDENDVDDDAGKEADDDEDADEADDADDESRDAREAKTEREATATSSQRLDISATSTVSATTSAPESAKDRPIDERARGAVRRFIRNLFSLFGF